MSYATGLIPRDYTSFPSGYCSVAAPFPQSLLIPENEWEERLKEQQAKGESCYELRNRYYPWLKSLNQGQHPLCWSFSTTKSAMYVAARMNAKQVRYSAWWVAGRVTGWRDVGGWNTQSLDKIATEGVPTEEMCPNYSRQYDTAEVKADAATRKFMEWFDGSESRDMNRQIMISAFLMGLAPALDFNHIGHSMCGCRLVSINPLVIDCDNSWGEINDYGEKGLYRLTGQKAIPDGMSVPRVLMPT